MSRPLSPQIRSPWLHTSSHTGLVPRATSGTYTAVVEPPFVLLNLYSLPFVPAGSVDVVQAPKPYCRGPCANLSLVRIYINRLLLIHSDPNIPAISRSLPSRW